MEKFFYLRNDKNEPVVCVASFREGDCIHYAFCTKNPLDRFDKVQARKLASVRLSETAVNTLGTGACYGQVTITPGVKGVKVNIVDQIACNDKAPTRARKVALRWLWENGGVNW